MKRITTILFVLAIVLGMVQAPATAAAPATYVSAVMVTNLTSSSGTIYFNYYKPDGTLYVSPISDAITAYETKVYDPIQPAGSFQGSLVISSDVAIAALSNLRGKSSGGASTHFASFSAFAAGTKDVYLPMLMRNNYGYSTQVSVQNAGASAVDLTVTYSDGQVNSATALQPGASVTFNQLDETHAANTVFAGKISASTGGQIVATVVQVGDALFAYSGFGAGSTTPTFPAVNVNNYGYWTSILVQNLGTQPTDVTIAYTHTPGRAGTDCVETNTIPAGQAKRFVEYAFTWSKPGYGNVTDCTFGSTFVGAGKVTVNSNSQPLAAVVAQNDLRVEKMRGGSYSAFDSNGGSNVIVMPIIMDRNYGFWTSWFIQNAGTTSVAAGAITCNVKGKDINGTAVNINITNPDALTQDDVWLKDHINAIANRFVGGAICTGPVGSRLIAVVNQLGQTASDPWVGVDSFMTYEGINP